MKLRHSRTEQMGECEGPKFTGSRDEEGREYVLSTTTETEDKRLEVVDLGINKEHQ